MAEDGAAVDVQHAAQELEGCAGGDHDVTSLSGNDEENDSDRENTGNQNVAAQKLKQSSPRRRKSQGDATNWTQNITASYLKSGRPAVPASLADRYLEGKSANWTFVNRSGQSWKIELRRRTDALHGGRTELMSGWVQFKNDLALEEGHTVHFSLERPGLVRFSVNSASTPGAFSPVGKDRKRKAAGTKPQPAKRASAAADASAGCSGAPRRKSGAAAKGLEQPASASPLAAAAAAAAGAREFEQAAQLDPHGFVGAKVLKLFKGFGWHLGCVRSYEAEDRLFWVDYPDGDQEQLDLRELRAVLLQPQEGGLVGAKLRRSPQEGTGIVSSYDAPLQTYAVTFPGAEAPVHLDESAVVEVLEGGPPRRAWAVASEDVPAAAGGGSPAKKRGRPAKRKLEESGDSSPGAPAESSLPSKPRASLGRAKPAAVGTEFQIVQPPDSGPEAELYRVEGAGHERGVYALCDQSSDTCWRPIGPWITDTHHGTVPGRHAVDRRHLPDRQIGKAKVGSGMVPGWIGVKTSEGPWTEDYSGTYHVVLWDRTSATKQEVLRPFDTVEEAARMYDRLAIAYQGPERAETNYPVTEDLVEAAGEWEAGTPRSLCTLAVRLHALSRCMADGSTSEDVPQEEWDAWEERVLEGCACKQPRKDMIPALVKDLKWAISLVETDCILPAWDGAGMKRFLQDIGSITTVGSHKDHYFKEAATCLTCALAMKSKPGALRSMKSYGHGVCSLYSMVRTFRDHIMSGKAMDAVAAGNADGALEAAKKEQRDTDKDLAPVLALMKGGTASDAPSGAARKENRPCPAPRAVPAPHVADSAAEPDRAPRALRAEEPLPPGLNIIVIGGGVSGLKAAGDLQRAGAKVTVLEGRDRLGGRVNTGRLTHGVEERPVDLGASFVCGTSRVKPVNPMFTYAVDRLGLQLTPKRRDGPMATAVYGRDGKPVPAALLDSAEAVYSELLGELLEYGQQAPMRESVAEAVHMLMSKIKMTQQEKELVEAYLSDLYVTTLDRMSIRGMVSNGFDGDHELVVGGYSQVVAALERGVPHSAGQAARPLEDIRLGSMVTRVELVPGGGVRVHVAGQAEPLTAHAAVVTLPLGVLKAGSVAFEPPLPAFKQKAMAELDMGTENRVAMLFPKVFWPPQQHFLRPVAGRYTFANLHALGVENVLCAWVRPQFVPEVEAMTDAETMADVEGVLRGLYGAAYVPPLDYTVTRWASDPFSRGSYSFVPVTGRKAAYDEMSWPVSGDPEIDAKTCRNGGRGSDAASRLFFAGEATHKEDAYTVHGAYMSGEREARKIKKWWRHNHRDILAQVSK